MTTHQAPSSERRWTTGRILLAGAIAAMVAMWVYILYLAIGPGRQPPPDRLEDPTFATAAQQRCSEALDDVAALPRAGDTATADQRADVVEAANAIFTVMLEDVERLAPAGEDGEIVLEWIGDWRTYLGDRSDYAEALRSDPKADLLVSAKDNDQITKHIDAFAADNKMISCGTPIDV